MMAAGPVERGAWALPLGVVAGLWAGFNPMIQTLLVLMAADLLSGLLSAWSTGWLSSDASFRGMAKKAGMLVMVGASHAFSATQSIGFDAAAAVAGFFCVTELISVAENVGRLGVPLPRVLVAALAKLREQLEAPPEKPGDKQGGGAV